MSKNIIIVAYDKNRGIGFQGGLPWNPIKEDMKHFRETTTGHPVIMGRRTFYSIPERFRPLEGRLNIILSTDEVFRKSLHRQFKPTKSGPPQITAWSGIYSYSTYYDLLGYAAHAFCLPKPDKGVFIIGGASVYKQALENNLIDRVIASEIDGEYKCDTFFPELPGWEGKTTKEFDNFKIVEYKKP